MKLRRVLILIAVMFSMLAVMCTTVAAQERLSLGYTYGSSKPYIEIIEQTKNSINVVAPTCFNINMSGKLTEDLVMSEEFVDKMHEQGIKVTPFLSNHWGQKRAQVVLKKPQNLINALVAKIIERNYDGVNIDLENLEPSDKEALTNFVKLLRETLPKEKTISVAVAANPNKLATTWIAAYDYKALSEYADYLVLMAYDEHCYGGSEGPVASIGFVEQSLKVMFEEVPKDRVVLGIPLYGRYWKEYEETGGEAIIIGTVERIIEKYKLVPKYNMETGTPELIFEVYDNEVGPMINGRIWEPGVYHIYYENETSIKAKLELVNKYNILGTALWALDNESPEFWNYYKDGLNATPYITDREFTIIRKYESAVKKFNSIVIENEIQINELIHNEHSNKIKTIVRNCIGTMNENLKKYDNFEKLDLSQVVTSLFADKSIRQIKIKRYIVDKDNKLKVDEEKSHYTMNLVTVPRSKALIVV